MALVYRPHTVSVQTASQKVTSNTVDGVTLASAVDVLGQLTPANAKSVYDQHNIELESPMLFMCNVEDLDSFTLGSKVTKDGTDYTVVAFESWDAIDAISCGHVILRRNK